MPAFSRLKDYLLVSRTRILGTAFALLVAFSGGVYLVVASQAATTERATVHIGSAAGTKMGFDVGFDHTQSSHIFGNGNAAAASSAKKLLSSINAPQNVHIMGFGVDNIEPSKGKFEFERSDLDNHVRVMSSTASEDQRIITLCTAPGWMKNGNDWDMNAAPTASHYSDFATLSAAVAARYDGKHKDSSGKLLPKVNYFSVWNEFKGFYLSNGDFDSKGFTTMYNDVYAAVKKARPDAKIGGPYVGMNTDNPSTSTPTYGTISPRSFAAMRYWLQNKMGADFITMDGGPQLRSGYLATNGYAAGDMFADAASYIRSLSDTTYPGARTLPMWWTEFYPGTNGIKKGDQATGQHAVSIAMDNFRKAGQAGINKVLLWEAEGFLSGDNPDTHVALWTDASKVGGGKSTAFYTALKGLHDNFPVDTPLYSFQSSNNLVTGLASSNSVMLIVRGNKTVVVDVDGTAVTLKPYEVRYVNR